MALLEISLDGPNLLRLSGDLDLSSGDQLSDAFAAIPGPVQLNMAGVTFMDSTGINLLLHRSGDRAVRLVAASEAVQRALGLGGLTILADGSLTARE